MDCNKECTPYEAYIKVVELARAYVPFQNLCSIYDQNEAMIKGTIFPELARPYCKEHRHIMKEENPCHSKHQNTMEEQNPCCDKMQDRPSPYRLF